MSRTLFRTSCLALLLLLAACGGPGAPAVAPTATPARPAIASSAPRTDGKLRVTTTNAPDPNDPAQMLRHELLLEAFAQLRPDVEVVAQAGSFNKAEFAAKFAAGTMEDAYLVPFTEPQDLIAKGYAADITELIEGWDNFYSFNPEALKIVQDRQGRIYGVPVGGYTLGLLYNRKLFEQAGLDPDQPPTTWEQLRQHAKQIAHQTDAAGFAELSKGNQGGWHFTAWIYSFGGNAQEQRSGRWLATFNDDAAVAALETLKAMRWTDQSMTEQQSLAVDDVLALMAQEQVAMAIMAPDALQSLKTQFQANIDDFGMGPLPQGGGNATLAGGAAWIFNPSSPPEVIKAAFEWTINRDFNLTALEADLKGQRDGGALVGWPQFPLFGGEFLRERNAIVAKYSNAPVANYRPYVAGTLQLRPEPPIETQQMYALLDTALLTVLTDPQADPQQVLDDSVAEFQTTVLDPLNPPR